MTRVHRFGSVLLIALLGSVAAPAIAQTAEDDTAVVGFNLLGPAFGLYSGSFEQALDDYLSIFLIPSYLNPQAGIFDPLASRRHIEPEDYHVWSLSVAAGAHYFVNGLAPTGVFAGVWLQPGYGSFRFDATALDPKGDRRPVDGSTVLLGAGAHVGYRLIWDPVSITPRVGVSYQLALNDASGFHPDMKNLAGSVKTGLQFPWGIEVGIAF